MLQCIFKIRF